ncbi:MAG: SUMF1/EgtB/PvdO family nonheme iron enzyme [Bacteroidales bacterium]|nr:SUMF1/EgtB/PvdO family nonheme iron enzyme [Bacteroidales bacterium]
MKKLLFLLVALAAFANANAQLVVAEECAVKEGDITAFRLNDQQPIIIDGDTIPFALVRVGLAEPNVIFDSKWVLKQEFIDNEYWVYFMDGVKSVAIKSKRYAPLHYRFPEPLKAKSTYVLTIHKPEGDKYKGTLNISSNVKDAQVYVDGVKVSDGTPYSYMGEGGAHHIELRADGYASQQRDVEIRLGQTDNITINLFDTGALSVDGISYGVVPVEATSYSMGSDLNYYTQPRHTVSLIPFSVGTTLVNVDLWEKVMGSADDRIKGSNGQVVNVSYDEIQDFISALNQATGKEFRLPTEAEWEYIAKNASKLGISDMFTSMEWCADWFGRYNVSDNINPQGPEKGVLRVVRGGSEYTDGDPTYSDPTFRWRKQADTNSPKISFRLVSNK